MKNKQTYWEFIYSGLKPLFHVWVILTLVFLMMIGFLGLFHKFIISQPLLGPHDLFSDLGNLIFTPFIDLIKKLVVFIVGNDFENSRVDYVSIFGFGILLFSFGVQHIYCKFLNRK
ncbi:MAG: hypothetical protein NTZ86_09785 [Legionellales bacterium]|nr:hypothetical protein [Legionellales bacterium]